MIAGLLFFAIAVLVTIFYGFGAIESKKKLAQRFERREDKSIDDFYDLFYKSSGIEKNIINELLNHVAAELTLPVSKLLPSDQFDIELAPAKGWEWGAGQGMLTVELQKWAKEKGRIIDTSSIKNLDDYLRVGASVY